MMPQGKFETRLCPHCANTIGADAVTCPYCKSDLISSAKPEWPNRDMEENRPVVLPEKAKLTVRSKAILILGLLVFAFGVYLVGANVERQDLRPAMDEQQHAIEEKDEKIKSLESQLIQLRQDNQGTIRQVEQLKAKLEGSEKNLAAVQRKLTAANREIERLSASRIASAPRPAAKTPAPQATSAAKPRITGGTERTYETVRTTSLYQEPASSAPVLAQITKGTQITVVGSGDGWLEVRSKHGKPPGFIRADDAMFVSRAK